MIGLYIHIPFCCSICSYCDFKKQVAPNKTKTQYIRRLIEEFDLYENELNDIDTIYIGGGTPNSLPLDDLEKLLQKIDSYHFLNVKEYTIEINPELLTEEQVLLFKKYKISRISIGVQSFDNEMLKILNRKHTYQDVENAIKLLRKYEITNINLDMMFAIPKQTIEVLKHDIKQALSFNVPHISYYNLILEEKTILMYEVENKRLCLLDEDLEALMYELVIKSLKDANYNHYEISNFAINGFDSKHNLHYWNTDNYIGLGVGASGYLNHIRYDNDRLVNSYLKQFIKEELKLTKEDEQSEFFIMGLRKISGVSIKDFEIRFGVNPYEIFPIHELIDQGLLEECDMFLRLTKRGLLLGNQVFGRFL